MKTTFKMEETNSRCEDASVRRYITDIRGEGTIGNGIVNNKGRKWQEQHRFMMTTLKEFGFGKSSMEEIVSAEIEEFKDFFREEIEANNVVRVEVRK